MDEIISGNGDSIEIMYFPHSYGDAPTIFKSYDLFPHDMYGLREGGSINDNVVDGWIDTFKRRLYEIDQGHKGYSAYKCGMLSTCLFSVLARSCYNYEHVRRWTTNICPFGDIFALDRLFIPIIAQSRVSFVMVDMQTCSLRHYDAYENGWHRANEDAVGEFERQKGRSWNILSTLRRWICDECLSKKNIKMDERSWRLVPWPEDLPRLDQNGYKNDAVFTLKGIECLARGESLLEFTDEMIPHFRRCIALEIKTRKLVCDEVRRRHRKNVGTLYCSAKLIVAAIRARKRAWEPSNINVASLEEHFYACR